MTATMQHGERLGGSAPCVRPPLPRRAVAAAVGGVMLAATATVIVASPLSGTGARNAGLPPISQAEPRFPTIGTAANTYAPGHSSGWHVHPGLHSVVVLSGVLTVYDESCGPSEFRSGETYLGGSTHHLARNEGAEVLDVAITYIYQSTGEDHGSSVSPPAGCGLR